MLLFKVSKSGEEFQFGLWRWLLNREYNSKFNFRGAVMIRRVSAALCIQFALKWKKMKHIWVFHFAHCCTTEN